MNQSISTTSTVEKDNGDNITLRYNHEVENLSLTRELDDYNLTIYCRKDQEDELTIEGYMFKTVIKKDNIYRISHKSIDIRNDGSHLLNNYILFYRFSTTKQLFDMMKKGLNLDTNIIYYITVESIHLTEQTKFIPFFTKVIDSYTANGMRHQVTVHSEYVDRWFKKDFSQVKVPVVFPLDIKFNIIFLQEAKINNNHLQLYDSSHYYTIIQLSMAARILSNVKSLEAKSKFRQKCTLTSSFKNLFKKKSPRKLASRLSIIGLKKIYSKNNQESADTKLAKDICEQEITTNSKLLAELSNNMESSWSQLSLLRAEIDRKTNDIYTLKSQYKKFRIQYESLKRINNKIIRNNRLHNTEPSQIRSHKRTKKYIDTMRLCSQLEHDN